MHAAAIFVVEAHLAELQAEAAARRTRAEAGRPRPDQPPDRGGPCVPRDPPGAVPPAAGVLPLQQVTG